MRASLDEKIAWVTGAGSGIGQAGAAKLAGAGATVVLSGRRKEALQETKALIDDAGGRAEIETLDVADAGAVEAACAAIVERHGRLDILVNCAGINIPNRSWETMDAESWDKVVRINLDGAFYATQAVLPQMRKQQDGLIINITSWAGHYDTLLTGPAYNASKHGQRAMSAHLNIEEGKNGIRACTIAPGEVNTPIIDKRPVPVPQEERQRMLQMEDLGETILFVCEMPGRVCLNEILISPTWNRLNMSAIKG